MKITFNKVNSINLTDDLLKNNIKFDVNNIMSIINDEDITLQNTTFDFDKNVNLELINNIVENHNLTSEDKKLTEIEKLRIDQAKSNAEMIQLILSLNGGN